MHPEPVSATRRSAATQTGPLRSGNPRGDPNLAPRCGAKARQTGCACRAPAMANGRCRMHGGASTGARTAAGLHRLAAVNTIHGRHAAGAAGDEELRIRTILRRTRLAFAADFLRAFLSPELAAVLETRAGPAALATPRYGWRAGRGAGDRVAGDRDKTLCTSGGGTGGRDARGRFAARPRPELRGQAAAQAAARVEAAALAPWREAIARARLAKRTVRLAKRAARAARVAERAAARAALIDTVGKKSMHQDDRPLAGLVCGGSAQRPHTPRDIGVDEAGGSRRARMAGVARALRGQFGSDGAAAGDSASSERYPMERGAVDGGPAGPLVAGAGGAVGARMAEAVRATTGDLGRGGAAAGESVCSERHPMQRGAVDGEPAEPLDARSSHYGRRRAIVLPLPSGGACSRALDPGVGERSAPGEGLAANPMVGVCRAPSPAASRRPLPEGEVGSRWDSGHDQNERRPMQSLPPGDCPGGGAVGGEPAGPLDARSSHYGRRRAIVLPLPSGGACSRTLDPGVGERSAPGEGLAANPMVGACRAPSPAASRRPLPEGEVGSRWDSGHDQNERLPMQSLPPGACPGGGAVRPCGNPSRQRLLGSVVDGTLAWRAAQSGGWAVMAAGAKAIGAGEDWLPAAWEAQLRTTAAEARMFARFMGRTVGWAAETLRWEGLGGDG